MKWMSERVSERASEQTNDNGLCDWLHRKTNISLAPENCHIHTHKFILIYYKSAAAACCWVWPHYFFFSWRVSFCLCWNTLELLHVYFISTILWSMPWTVNNTWAEIVTLPFVHLLVHRKVESVVHGNGKKTLLFYFILFMYITLRLTSWKLTLLTAHTQKHTQIHTQAMRVQPFMLHTMWQCSLVFHSLIQQKPKQPMQN